jgi:predicted DNA-binding protein (UPF0251 family)
MRRSFFPRVRREKLSSIRDNYLNAVGVAAQGANFSISAEMMRRILVDAARGWMRPGGGCGPGVDAARGWMRPGGGCGPGRAVLRSAVEARPWFTSRTPRSCRRSPDDSIVAVDEALAAFSKVAPRQAKVVELHCFGGLTEEEIAEVMKISRRTVRRDWQLAKAWLTREMSR